MSHGSARHERPFLSVAGVSGWCSRSRILCLCLHSLQFSLALYILGVYTEN